MAEPKNAPKTKVEVEIPALDLYDRPHPGVRIGYQHYGPGIHTVDPVTASTIRDRLLRFQHDQVRLLRPSVDRVSIEQAGRRSGTPIVDATTLPEASSAA